MADYIGYRLAIGVIESVVSCDFGNKLVESSEETLRKIAEGEFEAFRTTFTIPITISKEELLNAVQEERRVEDRLRESMCASSDEREKGTGETD